MARERLVVWQRELHAAYDGVQALGLGAGVLLVHQVCVMDDLRDLAQHRVVEGVLFEEGLKGAVLTVVGEPGPPHMEGFAPSRAPGGTAEEAKEATAVTKARNKP